MIGPRVRVRPRCDDEDDYGSPCPSTWQHPLFIAAATVAMQAVGEIIVRRYLQSAEDSPRKKGPRRE